MVAIANTTGLTAGERTTTAAGLWTVAFLGVTAGVQMSDRGLQSILSPAIQASFGVSDAVIGALHGIAGILVASALAVPLARLADRYSRKSILLGLILLWGMLTALSGIAPDFELFFIGRAASGITEFAMIPVVYSLIPDLVSDRHRVPSNLAFAALMATGASAGFYFGGNLLEFAGTIAPADMEPWRAALLCLSLLALPLLTIGLLVHDPPRGLPTGSERREDAALGPFLRAHQRRILLFLGAAGGLAIAVQAVAPMAAMGLVRRYASDLVPTGHALGLITLVTSLGSLAVAGIVDRFLRPRLGEASRPAVMAAGATLAIPCLIWLGAAPTEQQALAMIALFLALTSTANALIPTILQDIVPAELRARSFAIYSFVIAAFCALGPLLTGGLSDRAVGGNLLLAMAIGGVPALAAAAMSASLMARQRGG
ncbi:Predicted arabinose efflux permease, MFS family [Sphingopyxis sp. YR583]|uniref:MFS transporter n=1 Tax=Sphingopyxis sp. YR583 TaxID=1881047 RepID=UPI0008A7812E|nr:MFS transporter [Sphingopyxis sp. YR583]SEH13376.1 Predicted arabinose efflux permease, MFS family [Sphingopyxis sp. YR583]